MTIIEGYIKVPDDGAYIFAVNAYDAVDVLIDNKLVSSWYGQHGRISHWWYGKHGRIYPKINPRVDYDGITDTPIILAKGYHKLEFRHHKYRGDPIVKDAYELYWERPRYTFYAIVGGDAFFHCAPPELDFEYRFDECYDYNGTLEEVTDSSGNNYHGVASGKVMSPEKGIINNTRKISAIISSRSPTDIGAKGSISFWYWHKNNEEGKGKGVMLIDATKEDKYFFLRLTLNKSLLFWADNANGNNFRSRTNTNLALKDGWNHIAMTWNYTDIKFNLYVNGKQENLKESTSKPYKAVIPSLSNIHIGNMASDSTKYDTNFNYHPSKNSANGKFDEFKAYRSELSVYEVQNIYNNEKEGKDMDGTTRKASCCCRPTNGNLINNPSFENLCGSNVVSIWKAREYIIKKDLCGWNSVGGEGLKIYVYDDGNFIRLDKSKRADTIWQLVNSLNEKDYTIKFDYQGNIENLITKWNNKIIKLKLDLESPKEEWKIATATVVGTAKKDKFSLEIKGESTAIHIDNIRVVESEPTEMPVSIVEEKPTEVLVSIFDAWDINKNINKRTISTKKVSQDFNLSIFSLNEDNNASQDYSGTVCVRLVGEHNSTWSKVELTSKHNKDIPFNVDRADKDTRVEIAWKNEVDEPCPVSNETNSTLSSDNFAIRPDKFNLTLPALAYAGENFNIDFTASRVLDYNETLGSSFNIESNISRCIDGSLHVTPFSFENGAEKSVDANYTDIGDINITIKEILGSEFAVVDKDDTSVENRLITPDTKNMIIKPYELNITDVKYDEGWLYMADVDDINQSVEFSVLANNKQHILVKNFTEYCYAEDVDVKTHFNVKNINSNVEIKYNNATIYNIKDINKTITIPKASFINSKANIEYSFNVVRAYKIPYEPIQIGLREVSVESSNVAKEKNNATVSLDAEFYYGRVKTKDLSTNEQSTPHSLHVEVYKLGKYKQNSLNWYVNEDDNDSNMTIVDKKDFLFHSANAELDNIGNKQASDGSVEFILKHSEKDSFKSYLHVNIPEYLWYSKYNSYNSVVDCGSHPCFEYNYIGDRSQKNINSGKFIGTAVGDDFNATKTKKGVKVFR